MTKAIEIPRKDLIGKLSSISDDNVSIQGITIDRHRLLEALKLQTDDLLTINYGKASWHYKYKKQGNWQPEY